MGRKRIRSCSLMKYYDIHTHQPAIRTEDTAIVNSPLLTSATDINQSSGIHPWSIHQSEINDQLAKLELNSVQPNLVAIGEAGLDKHSETPMNIQKEVFSAQALLAEKVNKPLIIHCVKAWTELIAVKKHIKPRMPWIIHGFRGNAQLATQLIHYGFLLSFGLYFNPGALEAAWPSSLFAETDDKEIDIRLVYQRIADSLSLPLEAIILQLEQNVHLTFLQLH